MYINTSKKAVLIVMAIIVVVLIALVINRTATVNQTANQTIKIGDIAALTGVGVAIGEEEHNGAVLAVEQINANGGILGKKIELISEDLSIDRLQNAGTIASKLINIDKVVGIVGPQWDEPALAILPIVEKAKVPLIGPDTSDTIEKDGLGDYLFSTWYDNRFGIDVLLKFAQEKGIKRITIMRPSNAGFWKFTSDLVVEKAPKYDITIVEDIDRNDPFSSDYRTILTKMKVNHPDALFTITTDPIQCPLFKQMRELGFAIPVLATESSGNYSSLESCAGDMGNLFFSTPRSDFKEYQDFEDAYATRFGHTPRSPSAVTAYDGVRVLVHALEKTGGEGGEVLQKALSEIRDFPGVSQPVLTFKPNGFVETSVDTFVMKSVKVREFIDVTR